MSDHDAFVARMERLKAEQDAAARDRAWKDTTTHISPSTPSILRILFGKLNDVQAKAGRTKPLLHTRRHRP